MQQIENPKKKKKRRAEFRNDLNARRVEVQDTDLSTDITEDPELNAVV